MGGRQARTMRDSEGGTGEQRRGKRREEWNGKSGGGGEARAGIREGC